MANIIYTNNLKEHFKEFTNCKLFIITDEVILNIYEKYLSEEFKYFNYKIIKTLNKENAKTISEFTRITELLINEEIKKEDVIISFGGGSINDLSGFISSVILRGVSFINIPTTLLSMVDASIGGKTGINLSEGKNLIGSFKDSLKTIINIDFLKTLPQEELINGFAEIVKIGFVNNRKIFDLLNDFVVTETLINEAVSSKLKIVKDDYYENNIRKYLNFGHTFAHSIEKLTNYEIPHGVAVFQGMEIALKIGMFLNVSDKKDLDLLNKYLKMFNIKSNLYSSKELMKYIKFDKKNSNQNYQIILIKKSAIIYDVSEEELYELLNKTS